MKRILLGVSDLEVSRIAIGAMRYAVWPQANAADETALRQRLFAAYDAAWECGINLVDHADIYAAGRCELLFGQYLKERPGLRERLVIQSKCGIRFGPSGGPARQFDFSKEHIVNSVEASIERMGCGWLDVLLLHRPDCLIEPEEVAAAFDALHTAGKVRWFGVSNHGIQQIELLSASLNRPLIANQLQLNMRQHALFSEGVLVNSRQTQTSLQQGLLDYCRRKRITVQPWCPIAKEFLPSESGSAPEHQLRDAADVLQRLADAHAVSPDAIQIAWLLRHPAKLQPVIGTTRPERVRAQCAADTVELSRLEWYEILAAARAASLP